MNAPLRSDISTPVPASATRGTALRNSAEELLRTSGAAAAAGARRAVQEMRARPVTTGLVALSALGGGALLMNPALRRLALANAPLLWRLGKRTVGRARQQTPQEA